MEEGNNKTRLAERIVLETGCSLFLTGKAGTGKTTFLRGLRAKTHKRMIVTAPTGIAAINAGGMTLHSFFQLDFAPFVPGMQRPNNSRSNAFSKEKIRIIRGLDLLVIDEVSMVRADVLDAVDDVLRRFRDRTRPFGGVQLLLIGDLQQLPPVVVESERHLIESNYRSPYFFDSHALQRLDYLTIELTKVYRQNDRDFIELLNAVRDNRTDAETLNRLNSRCIPGFNPEDREGYVRLTTHNHMADSINRRRMEALHTPAFTFRAKIQGSFPETSYPAEKDLTLKCGAQVMFIKNDTDKRYFNGMMGKVTEIDKEKVVVTADDTGQEIEVEPEVWENIKYVVNDRTKEIEQKTEGVFSQLPLKPAWAITIHKSQGLTFDKAIIDASSSFSHGQTYVALSRCRTLEGMVLDRPLTAGAIINDPTVTNFLQAHKLRDIDDTSISRMVDAYSLHLATEMFNFRPIFNAMEGVTRLYNENFISVFPQMVINFSTDTKRLGETLIPVHDRFMLQIKHLDEEAQKSRDRSVILQRLKDASAYFLEQLGKLTEMLSQMPTEHDNKKVASKLRERIELFEDLAYVRKTLLEAFRTEDFEVDRYLELKAEAAFRENRERRRKKESVHQIKSEKSADNQNPVLFDMLRKWRYEKSQELGVPAFTVMSNKTLLAVSNAMPEDMFSLLICPGIGKVTADRYGEDVLGIVDLYRSNPEVD